LRSLSSNQLYAEGAAALAPALAANGGLTELSIFGNDVGDKGVDAICEAIKSNKETKLASLNFGDNSIGPVGANTVGAMVAVTGALTSVDLSGNHLTDHGRDMTGIKELAAALGVNGGLTVINLLGNQLDAESAKLLAEVAKQKGISLCGIQRDQTFADFSRQDLRLQQPDAILLASDLSQAVVTGALTRVDVRNNNIVGDGAAQLAATVLGNLKIEMFNEIPIKEMRADSLTELDLKGKGVGVAGVMVVAGLIPAMGALTQVLAFCPRREMPLLLL